jgi:hypothetical protein
MKAALLPDRGVVKVAGTDAAKFLDGLVTTDLDKVTAGNARYSALLTPQGKIIADFIVVKANEDAHYFLDCPRALASTLVQRLNFYKLRAKVIVEDLSETLAVLAVWDGAGANGPGLCYPDPRLAALGLRCMIATHLGDKAAAELGASLVEAADYDAHRIALGVPRGGSDFIYNDAFPHEADMDQLGGVDFTKGCYTGQEVVARMEHRGTARRRVIAVTADIALPAPGTPIMAGDIELGTLGSADGTAGLASLRLDRAADALRAGRPITASGVALQLAIPEWARFGWPEAAAS